ncbi:MAG: hypothetical protein IPF64_17655 [Flavobacteriales bacterium]|nr:hypothetical protein [Flavobacteriales bacterium]
MTDPVVLRSAAYLAEPHASQVLNILIIGTEVGLLAQQRFPGGVDCTPEHHYDYAPALAATQAALAAGAPVVYEAAFQHDGVLAALDILVRDGAGCLTSWSSIPYRHAMNGVRPTSFIVLTFA